MRNLAAFALVPALAVAGAAGAADGQLSVRPLNSSGTEVSVQPGGSFTVRVSLDEVVPGAVDLTCNANLLRLVLTEPGVEVTGYTWTAPWQTGGPTDQSLRGLVLPVAVYPETLQGAGYPINTVDVEFGNFLMTGSAQPGEYLRVSLRVPTTMAVGSDFYVVAYPDSFTDGFDPLSVIAGAVLRVRIVSGTSPTPGDLNGDTSVNGADLALLLGMWGTAAQAGDLNGDGVVGGPDLGLLLSNWS